MKDKVLFFILGAVLATIAYFLGDLETTAEDEYREIDALRVNRLHVKDSIVVGDTGKKLIVIMADDETAQIRLDGAELSKNREDFLNNTGEAPSLTLAATDTGAVINAASHNKRPEATGVFGVLRMEGKYESKLVVKDSDGKNGVSTD